MDGPRRIPVWPRRPGGRPDPLLQGHFRALSGPPPEGRRAVGESALTGLEKRLRSSFERLKRMLHVLPACACVRACVCDVQDAMLRACVRAMRALSLVRRLATAAATTAT
eukprot:5931542-Alexandrium_andersonii.AAC.1